MYKYRPIDLDRPAVRLVRLLKGNITDEIQCDLFEGWINQSEGGIPYDALSYTWGSTEKAAKIIVNGSTMHVTSNLFIALQHLRFQYEDRILWIDAICIDQFNHQERRHQVQQMSYIYKEAEQVVIWLGQGTEKTDFVMDSIKRLHENNVKVEGDWRLSAQLWMRDRAVTQPNQGDIQTWREGMELILKRPWFSRIWILQEIANARVAKVICGKKSVSARTFAQFPSLIELRPDPHCQAVLDVMPGLSRKESWWSDKRNLHTLLVKFRGSLATDERDIIYALLGISSDACSSDILHPDYTKSLQQVIRNTTSFLMPQINKDESFYKFLDWTLSEFLQNLDSLGSAVFGSASENGEEAAVKLLLAMDGVRADWKDKYDRTPLQRATQNGHEAVVRLLVTNGAGLETKDSDGQTSLLLAIKNEHEAIVQLLLEKGAELEKKDNDGWTPLFWAVTNGNQTVVRLLLENGAELETKDKDGRTLLSWAATSRNQAVVKLLLKNGAQLESKDSLHSRTPLFWAATSGNQAIVKLLLENGAELETKDENEQTPLLWAATSGNQAIAKLLLENGANLEAKDSLHGQTLLSWAARSGNEAAVKLLLKNGARLEAKDRLCRWTPLSWAAMSGNQAVVQLLLEKGANLEAKDDRHGQTPLSLAAERGIEAIVQLLLENGAELKTKDKDGRTPLMLAFKKGNKSVVMQLLRAHNSRMS